MQKRSSARSMFRIDKFNVPASARSEFLAKASGTHRLLETLDGCLQSLILEHVSGSGEFNFVTIVEWDSAESFEKARTAAAARQKEANFNPQDLFARLKIKADLANYSSCEVA